MSIDTIPQGELVLLQKREWLGCVCKPSREIGRLRAAVDLDISTLSCKVGELDNADAFLAWLVNSGQCKLVEEPCDAQTYELRIVSERGYKSSSKLQVYL